MYFRGSDGRRHEAMTVNISSQGLLFQASGSIPVSSKLDVHILPEAPGAAHVLCWGKVVRTEPVPGTGEQLVAMTIDQFQLRRAGPDQPPSI
jgi:hypothetical protein